MKNFPSRRRARRPFSLFFRWFKEDEFKRVEIVIEKRPAPREEADESGPARIRCPKCRWQPERSSLWQCSNSREPEGFLNGCGTIWNTFNTRGRCPGCGHQWRWTSCPNCHQWSLHEDWYEPVRHRG